MRNNLACLGGYVIHLDVADVSNLFYFNFVFNYANAYPPISINKELNLFLSSGYEHVSGLARWKDFTSTQKYIILLTEPARHSGYFFHINTELESNTSP